MNFIDLLHRSCLRVPLVGIDKPAVITELVDLLYEHKQITQRDTVLQAILARERLRSTGVGAGLAVPHAKCDGVPKVTVAVGKPTAPLDFDSADGRPCRMVVLIAGPRDSAGPHLQALAGISRLWLNPSFHDAACQSDSAEALLAAFEQYQI